MAAEYFGLIERDAGHSSLNLSFGDKMGIEKKLPAHEVGSGHIFFAELALPNAEEHELKAALGVELGGLGDRPQS